METPTSNILEVKLKQQIAEEEEKYCEALKQDAPFFKLKEIRKRIKMLRAFFNKDGNS